MWPWEHLAVAYVSYSLLANLAVRKSPSARETIAVVVGSQLPDLVDKPLVWTVGITETGYGIGHSLFVAPFVCLAVYVTAARGDRRLVGCAFSIAYLSHLVTDAFNPLRLGRSIEPRVVLWPITSLPTGEHGGFVDHVVVYVVRDATRLLAGGPTPQLVLQLSLGLGVVALWLADGAPIVREGWQFVRDRLRNS